MEEFRKKKYQIFLIIDEHAEKCEENHESMCSNICITQQVISKDFEVHKGTNKIEDVCWKSAKRSYKSQSVRFAYLSEKTTQTNGNGTRLHS